MKKVRGHGKIALLLESILAQRGDQVAGLVRNPAHIADVAAVMAALLDEPGTRHLTLELTSGDTPVTAAVHGLV